MRYHLVAVVVLLQLLVVWAVLGGLFLRESRSEVKYAAIEGFVCAQQCEQVCSESGCHYDGTLELCFVLSGTAWQVVADPQGVCGRDCCASLLRDQTPVWIVLDGVNPPRVADFYATSEYYSGPYDSGGTALVEMASLLGCGMLLAGCSLLLVRCGVLRDCDYRGLQ